MDRRSSSLLNNVKPIGGAGSESENVNVNVSESGEIKEEDEDKKGCDCTMTSMKHAGEEEDILAFSGDDEDESGEIAQVRNGS